MAFESIQEHVDDYVNSTGNLEESNYLVNELYKQNDSAALKNIIKMASSDYGGATYKAEYQKIACLGALHWGVDGLKALENCAINLQSFRLTSHVTEILAYLSSKVLGQISFLSINLHCVKVLELDDEKYKSEEWIKVAKEGLINVVKSVESNDTFPFAIMIGFMNFFHSAAQEHIFAALIARWFNISTYGIDKFQDLINTTKIEEIDCQNFLKSNPYILEPFHAQIWSKPRFGEKLVPDFLIRSMDNNYTVVEIERPDFPIMTKNGELSSKANHAKRQALDFRTWAIDNNLYARKTYADIYRPFCLVVIGMENTLSESLRYRLRQENESTQGVIKIVGFDWIYERAKATFNNLIAFNFNRKHYP
jgi:hypothetical protein